MPATYRATEYLRLSYANDHSGESDSISNQKKLVQDFLANHPDIQLVSTQVDDGYSGVIFDRPAFQAEAAVYGGDLVFRQVGADYRAPHFGVGRRRRCKQPRKQRHQNQNRKRRSVQFVLLFHLSEPPPVSGLSFPATVAQQLIMVSQFHPDEKLIFRKSGDKVLRISQFFEISDAFCLTISYKTRILYGTGSIVIP